MFLVSVVGSFAFIVSYFLTNFVTKNARAWGLEDVPNSRSAHDQPKPKAGGLSFFIAFFLLLFIFIGFDLVEYKILRPLLFGAPVVVALGCMDDRFSLPAWVRLFVHFGVAVLIFSLVTNMWSTPFRISFLPDIYWLNALFSIFFIAWFINLFNFMDGADGLVSSVSMVGALLLSAVTSFHGAPEFTIVYLGLAYSVAGFLVHNWSPAKIFMGDTGSYFLGFVFATLALMGKIHSNISFHSHIVIFAPFICDATYTLFVRLLRGERVYNAHRQQAFHKIIDRGWSHPKVCIVFCLVTVIWLFPLSNLASIYDYFGLVFVVIAYTPLAAFVVWHKAGLPETDVRESRVRIKQKKTSF